MKSTDKPSLIETVIASGAKASYVRTIPKTQTKSGSGEMSLDLGWPPECAIPVAAGGKYPQMADANGVLNLLSAAVQQLQARFFGPYNADFATAIGGYPLNAIVSDTTAGKFWVSTAEDNTTVPGASGASWQDLFTGYVKKSGDTSTGTQYNTQFFSGGFGGGWNGARTNTGDYGWTNGLAFGNPANDGKYFGTWTVTDVLYEGGSNSSGLNLTGYDADGKPYQWYFAWNGKVTTPGGVLAFESDLLAYFSAASNSTNVTLTNLQGVNWTSSATNSYVQVTGGGVSLAVPTVAYTSKQVADEVAFREAADAALQNQINGKQPAGNYVLADTSGVVIETFVATVTGNNQTVNLPRDYSKVIFVAPQNSTDGNGFGMTNVVSWTNSTALVSVASYHTGAPQGATITQTFLVIAVP